MKWLTLSLAFLLLLSTPLSAGISTKNAATEFEQGDAIVLTVDLEDVPEGAQLKGDVIPEVNTTAKRYEIVKFGPNVFGLWGTGGDYEVEMLVLWGVPHPDVPLAWSDFGLVKYKAELVIVSDGSDPPPPPPPAGPYKIWFALEAGTRDNLPEGQRQLVTSLVYRQRLEALKHDYQETLFDTVLANPPDRLIGVSQAIRESGLPLPVVVLEPIAGGSLDVLALPADYESLARKLEGE